MIKVSEFGEVRRLDLARSFAGKGRYWTTAYFFDGLLIDTGCAHTAGELERYLKGHQLLKIINTHSHEDHIGGNGLLQRNREGVTIFAHPLALEVLEKPKEKQPLQLYRKLFWGRPESSHVNPISDGAKFTTENHVFRVIYTPGHSPDHLCLYEPDEGWLFTGDLFVGGKDRALRAEYDIWQIVDSLRKIADLSLTSMFPGSARVRENPLQEIQRKIAYLEDLGGRVMELQEKGWEVGAIARRLCGGPMLLELLTLGHFSRKHLVLSYIRGANRDSIQRED
jgi:glyoxylase-like metal-dependent hydrolase (beta-lactamase superfamily II)